MADDSMQDYAARIDPGLRRVKSGDHTPSTSDNPFNPGFGVRPPVSAGRQTLVNEILARLGRGPGRHEFQTGAIASLKACLIARVSAESCGTTTSIDPGHT
jgi:hypothetical protein